MVQEILYANYIVLVADSMAELQEKIYGNRSAFESNEQKVNLMKTKVMVSKIGQVTVRPSSDKRPMWHWWQYYVNLVEIGYMEDVQRLKG